MRSVGFRAFLCVLAALASPAVAQRSVEVIGSSGGFLNGPQISSQGEHAYVAWVGGTVLFSHSTDRGGTWAAPRGLGSPASWTSGQRISSNHDEVYVVWMDQPSMFGGGEIYFTRSTGFGATWLSEPIRLDNPAAASSANSPRISSSGAIAGPRWVFAVWLDERHGTRDVYLDRSMDGGATWLLQDIRVEQTPLGTSNAGVAELVSAGDDVWVVWEDNRNGRSDIYFNRSLDGGATWLPLDARLDAGTGESYEPQVARSGADIHVVWADSRDGQLDIYFNRSTDGGATWLSQDVRLDTDSPGAAASYDPQICASGDDVFVVWADSRDGGSINFNRSTDRGATWLADDVRIDQAVAAGSTPSPVQMRVGNARDVHVVWSDQRSGQGFGVYYRRSPDGGVTWPTDDIWLSRRMPWLPGNWFPVISIGANVYVAWEASIAGSSAEIHFTVPYGFVPYGVGKAGSGGFVPRVMDSGTPVLGETCAVDLRLGLGGAYGAWLIGGPYAKRSSPLLGGTSLVDPAFALPFVLGGSVGVPGVGMTTLPLVVPNDVAFVGGCAYFQAAILDAGASFGVSLSDAVEMWVG